MTRIRNIKKGEREGIKREAVLPLKVLSRADYLTASVLSTLTFVVYAFTAAPGVTLADSADFIMGVLTLGIVHPPGYPLYTVLGHLFSLIPFGEPAFRVNLFSALWGSLCLGVVFLILRMLSIDRLHAIFATLSLGFTTVFWSKTAVAEVYSFNGFLIAGIVFWILSYNRDKKKSQLYLLCLTTGLALSNHYPLVVLTGIGLVFLLDRRDLQAGDYFRGLVFLGLGLTPYLYLFIQALNPEIQYNFGKLSDFGMVVDHILRKHYSNIYGGTVWDKFVLAFVFSKAIITNFLITSVFLVFGIGYSFIAKWRYRYPLLLAALSASLGLILILTFPSDDTHRALFFGYLIPTFIVFAVFLSIGSQTLMNRYVKNKIVQVSLLVILLLVQVGFNFGSSSHHNDEMAEIWGSELLNSLEPKSIVILCGRGEFALYYLQLVKGLRQDLTIYDRTSTLTKDNLYGPELLFEREDTSEYRKRREQQLINNSLRPIYYTCKDAIDEQKLKFSSTLFVFRVAKMHFEASDSNSLRVSERLLDSLVNGYPKSDHWLDHSRRVIFGRLISYYGGHERAQVDRILDYFEKSKFYSDPGFLLSAANNLYYFKNYELARRFYERSAEHWLGTFSGTDLAVFCSVLIKAKKYDKALGICVRQEQSSHPCHENTVKSRLAIVDIYTSQENWPKVTEISRKILECDPGHKIAERYLEMAIQRTE